MITLCLILVSAGILIHASVWTYSVVKVVRKYNHLAESLNEFVTPIGEDQISDFNKAINTIADIFADRYRIAMSATERGAAGAASRDLTRGLEEYATAENPQMGLYQMLPKSLKKNPLAFAGLNMLIQKAMESRGSGGSGGNHAPSGTGQPVKFKFDI